MDPTDTLQERELQLSLAAVNRMAAQTLLDQWDRDVMAQCTELSTYITHLYAQQLGRGMGAEDARAFCIQFMDMYIRNHGGRKWFLSMPDITGLVQ